MGTGFLYSRILDYRMRVLADVGGWEPGSWVRGLAKTSGSGLLFKLHFVRVYGLKGSALVPSLCHRCSCLP